MTGPGHDNKPKFGPFTGTDGQPLPEDPWRLIVPGVQGELGDFELPVEASQIANLLRRRGGTLDQARALVERLNPQLSQEPGGSILRRSCGNWREFNQTLGQNVHCALVMVPSAYNPDVVIACQFIHRLDVDQEVNLSPELLDLWQAQYPDPDSPQSMDIRLAPGAILSFRSSFLENRKLDVAWSEDPNPIYDGRWPGYVPVFHDSRDSRCCVSVSSFDHVYFDSARSRHGATYVYQDLALEHNCRVRWSIEIANGSDGRISIRNGDKQAVKVRVSPGLHVPDYDKWETIVPIEA